MRRVSIQTATLLAAISLAIPSPGVADSPPLVADRPAFTATAVTVPRGAVQHELGVTHGRTDATRSSKAGEWLVRWGLLTDFEVRLGWPSYAREKTDQVVTDGWTDSHLGLKWHSQDGNGPRPAAALLVGTSLPTGGKDFGEDTLQPDAAIAMRWTFGARTGLGAGVGYRYASRSPNRFDQWRASLLFGLDLGAGVACFFEGFGFNKEAPGGDAAGYLDAGVTWRFARAWQLDASGGIGDDGHGVGDGWFVRAGLVTRYGGS